MRHNGPGSAPCFTCAPPPSLRCHCFCPCCYLPGQLPNCTARDREVTGEQRSRPAGAMLAVSPVCAPLPAALLRPWLVDRYRDHAAFFFLLENGSEPQLGRYGLTWYLQLCARVVDGFCGSATKVCGSCFVPQSATKRLVASAWPSGRHTEKPRVVVARTTAKGQGCSLLMYFW